MGRDVEQPTGGKQPSQVRHSSRSDAISSNYQEAKAAMNRGHSLATSSALAEAIDAYSEAIRILDTLPPSQETSNSLGAALMNRGQLLHQCHGLEQAERALQDFQRAARLLTPLKRATWPRRNLNGVLLNQANLLLDLQLPSDALHVANTAIETVRFERHADPTDTELAVLAARSYCDAVGQLLPTLPPPEQDRLAQQANKHSQSALAHIRALRPYLPHEPFAQASQRLFHFGCLLLATLLPAELPHLIAHHFQDLQDERTRTQLINTSREAIQLALQEISKTAKSPHTSPQDQDSLAQLSQRLGELHQQLPFL
ncbi:hypothetical protein IEN85_19945 [Pelagicoccus sp. NFK12]|uniref:Tetratricopeptide repeat protein n=1 Tax=Pelagicoccus enzymogenes TaxID=2773457 RepID=A0A927IJE5_9BACT|nr:hypothetical protein [Pelagicoccus enzymogenes]MBD5781784.1 hypothetical protein [Pelagicoccus enzymogenes]